MASLIIGPDPSLLKLESRAAGNSLARPLAAAAQPGTQESCRQKGDAEVTNVTQERTKKPTSARLSVNINEETAEQLQQTAARKQISYTEAVRRAIAVWSFIEDEIKDSKIVQVVDPSSGDTRELVLL
jgi:hypothetical protein